MSLQELRSVWILAIVLLVGTTISRADEDATREGVAAAEAWLQLVDRGEIDKSWETAAALFKRSITEEDWTQKIEAVRKPLGGRVLRKVEVARYETALPGAPEGEYVVIRIKGGFENQLPVTEVVTTLRETDGQWRVVAYLIQ